MPNLQVVFCFICFYLKYLKKIFIYYFAISNIIVYRTTIILNILNKVINYMKFKIINNWSI